ncbi:MAG: hypothetical protein ACXIUP_00280 [Microcella sp.]|mgnify:FL=1
MTEATHQPTTGNDTHTDELDASAAPEPETTSAVTPPARERTPDKTPWSAKDYAGIAPGSGAVKLASSGVAPLVAAARGYSTVTPESADDFATKRGMGDRRSKMGRQFRGLFLDGGDALIMPWFRLDQMQASVDEIEAQRDTTVQYRPSNPRINEHGKVVKYEFASGGGTFLDVHPATPRTWFSSTPRTLIAEGLLKGDSALTAQLRTWYDDDTLAATSADVSNRNTALRRLAQLLDGIPQSERTSIVSIGGVGNWRQNPEWFGMRLQGKPVIVAFDGDVDTNWNVWAQAADMYQFLADSKKAEPALLSLSSNPTAAAALHDDPHMGLDDFFRSHGVWADLESMIQPDLPARPARADQAQIGDWRVSPDGLNVQEYVETPSEGSARGLGHWVTRVPLGGRVYSYEVHRPASDEENEGKPFGSGLNESNYPKFCSIELAWADHVTNNPVTATITGPSSILSYPPSEWERKGASIPKEIELHEHWPPQRGAEWLRAVKRNRADEIDSRTVWATMGWVPVEGEESQAFVVGKQVIAQNEGAARGTIPGVVGSQLTNAERFGLHDVYTGPNFTDPTGEHNLADDLRTLLDVYWYNTPWLNQRIAATMLSMALRPAVPLPTSVAAYFVGAPQKGKSWSARQCMSFWQARSGVWKHTLPGSASDTFATTESAVAKTPIWVVDDLAPQTDRKTAEMQESKIGDLIRAVHNKLGKRRMNRDMTEREVPTPMALTIFTAENEAPVQSIRERVVSVEFTGLRAKEMNAADDLANKTTVASRVTAALVRMYIARGQEQGWEQIVATLRKEREDGIEIAREILEGLGIARGDTSRPAEIAADLSMGLQGLVDLLLLLGMDEEADLIDWGSPEQMLYLVAEQVGQGHLNKAQVSPGQVLLDCIRGLLASGAGHIANVENPSAPPISGDNAAAANMLLGWVADSQGDMRPRGSTLGYLTKVGTPGSDKEPDEILFMLADDAFQLAQTKYPKRIQYGASPTTSWRNVWDLGLTHPRYKADPRKPSTRQFSVKGTGARLRGVPLSMEVLFSSGAGGDDEGAS